jgi:hypothetical protein
LSLLHPAKRTGGDLRFRAGKHRWPGKFETAQEFDDANRAEFLRRALWTRRWPAFAQEDRRRWLRNCRSVARRANPAGVNWDDLRIIAAVAEEGTYAGASARLRVNETTVARRLARSRIQVV